MLDPSLLTKVRADIDGWEKPVPWMYLDSEGYVTVGAGLMLPNLAEAEKLPFTHEATGRPVTKSEVETAWKDLIAGAAKQKQAAPAKKFSAPHYKDFSDIRMDRNFMDKKRDQDIQLFYKKLQVIYPSFDHFPEPAKRALFDMIYNLGPGRPNGKHQHASGLYRYTAMNAAIGKSRWSAAARLSLRHGIPANRNRWTSDLFLSCVASAGVH